MTGFLQRLFAQFRRLPDNGATVSYCADDPPRWIAASGNVGYAAHFQADGEPGCIRRYAAPPPRRDDEDA